MESQILLSLCIAWYLVSLADSGIAFKLGLGVAVTAIVLGALKVIEFIQGQMRLAREAKVRRIAEATAKLEASKTKTGSRWTKPS